MKHIGMIGILGMVLLLNACITSTKYQDGISHEKTKKNTYAVTFSGNSSTSLDLVKFYTLYRCAELTAETEGYNTFTWRGFSLRSWCSNKGGCRYKMTYRISMNPKNAPYPPRPSIHAQNFIKYHKKYVEQKEAPFVVDDYLRELGYNWKTN